jgi:copper oxidase (laccase) domain-containing protein
MGVALISRRYSVAAAADADCLPVFFYAKYDVVYI